MKFEDFVDTKKVIICEPDLQMAKSLVAMSEQTLVVVRNIELTERSASLVLSQGYESLRELLDALCLREGFKVYSHEAFAYYLRKIGEVTLSEQFDRLRKLRNGVHYYGKPVSADVSRASLEQIIKMRKRLKTLLNLA